MTNLLFCDHCQQSVEFGVEHFPKIPGFAEKHFRMIYCLNCIVSGKLVIQPDIVKFEEDQSPSDHAMPFLRLFRWADDEDRSSKSRIYEESFEQMIKRTN